MLSFESSRECRAANAPLQDYLRFEADDSASAIASGYDTEHSDHKHKLAYRRLRAKIESQSHSFKAILQADTAVDYRPAADARLTNVRLQTRNEYFRSFLKCLLFPKHSFW